MLLGYVRVSTIEQNETRQIEALKARNVERIYIDKQSGKDTNRPQYKEMIEFMRDGDIIITESISRIARKTKDLLDFIDTITEKNVGFVSLKENIDTDTATGKFMLTVFGAVSELEREYILSRQREGIEIAKDNGVYKGKPPMKIDEAAFAAAVAEWRAGAITAVEAMRRCDLKPNTFYRRVKERGL